MNTEISTPTTIVKRSTLIFLAVLCLCLTSAFLTASVVLILQYQKGIPFSLPVSLLLAAAVALILPVLITLLVKKFRKNTRYELYTAFILSNFAISIITGVLIF